MPTYTRANLYDDIARDAGSITNILRLVNRAARFVVGDIDLRSTKRRAYLSPQLHQSQWDYQAPSDLKSFGLIDIRRQADRIAQFSLVPSEEFDRRKELSKNLVCIEDRDFIKKLRISAELDGDQVVVHEMNSITADGTWATVLDASNLTVDSDNYINGTASLNFDLDQAGSTTTAGYIQNPDFAAVDLSDYENSGSVFIWVYIPGTTVDADLDGFTLRIGSSSTVYFSRQVTVTNENTTFQPGWNLLRFDFSAATETGTVDMDNVDYIRFAVDRGAVGLIQTTDWRVDYIVARRGIPHEVWYYTKFPWQSSAGTYLENSTAATDLINADTEEYELIITKAKEMVARDLKNFEDAGEYRKEYEAAKEKYINDYPSERLTLLTEYYSFSSLDQSTDEDND